MRSIPEKDWKQMSALKDKMLTMACERILNKVEMVLKARKGREHESYLELWKILRHEDEEISIMFDDLKRSNAIMKLVSWRTNSLLSDNDLEHFTEETRYHVKVLLFEDF